jgi:hypothetical protein
MKTQIYAYSFGYAPVAILAEENQRWTGSLNILSNAIPQTPRQPTRASVAPALTHTGDKIEVEYR